MDREILFRAVSQLDGNWVYGSLIKYDYEKPNMEDLSKPHIESSYDICRKESDWCFSYKNIPVFKETIGQYTEITDKNGKKIFEGDIVIINTPDNCGNMNGFIGKVKFHDGAFELQFVEDEDVYECLCLYEREDFEVIGNIHDNPELLEGL